MILFESDSPFSLKNILKQLQKIDPSMTLFQGYGVTNFYSTKHKYSVSPTVNLEKGELLFELLIPNVYVGNQLFAGAPNECMDWIRENLTNIIAASDFSGRVGTRDDYLVSIGENPVEADEFDPLQVESAMESSSEDAWPSEGGAVPVRVS
jgi:hypothetical protein